MNPVIQMLRGQQQNPLNQVMGMLQNGNPQQIFENMINTNPQFRQFVQENKDLTPQQMCQKFGVDPSILKLMK